MGVEPQEVDQLGRRVDLRLKRGLRLPEHRGRVQRLPPCRCQQLRGAEEHGRAILPPPACPLACRGPGRGNRLVDVLRIRRMPVGQHVLMVVRHDGLLRAARPNLAPADDDRNVDALGRHRLQTVLQLRAFGRAGQIAEIRLVDGRRHTRAAGDTDRSTQCCLSESLGWRFGGGCSRTCHVGFLEKSNAKFKMQNANTASPVLIRAFVFMTIEARILES